MYVLVKVLCVAKLQFIAPFAHSFNTPLDKWYCKAYLHSRSYQAKQITSKVFFIKIFSEVTITNE